MKKQIKAVLCLLLALTMCFCMVACGEDTQPENTNKLGIPGATTAPSAGPDATNGT